MTDSVTKCAWVIHESKAVQIHVHIHNNHSVCLGCLVAQQQWDYRFSVNKFSLVADFDSLGFIYFGRLSTCF